jgi:hypothetical protein
MTVEVLFFFSIILGPEIRAFRSHHNSKICSFTEHHHKKNNMKISTIALTSILFTASVQAGVTIIEFTDDCNYDTVAAAVADAGEDLSTWGLDGDEAQIEELCEEARKQNSSTGRNGGACKCIVEGCV